MASWGQLGMLWEVLTIVAWLLSLLYMYIHGQGPAPRVGMPATTAPYIATMIAKRRPTGARHVVASLCPLDRGVTRGALASSAATDQAVEQQLAILRGRIHLVLPRLKEEGER